MNQAALKDLQVHHRPDGFADRFAYGLVKFLRFFADAFFAKRYGHRAIVLETVAAIPGMVGGAMLHLKSLRSMKDDHGWIHTLLDEAENERMHLMTFVELEHPTWLERWLVILVQIGFYGFYLLLYLVSNRTAHRVVGYLEEEAVVSYTQYLQLIDSGEIDNPPAPQIAIEYWSLPANAKLRDVIVVIRRDEMRHREVNHCVSNKFNGDSCQIQVPVDTPSEQAEELRTCQERHTP